jgi:ankyrin repeat protein
VIEVGFELAREGDLANLERWLDRHPEGLQALDPRGRSLVFWTLWQGYHPGSRALASQLRLLLERGARRTDVDRVLLGDATVAEGFARDRRVRVDDQGLNLLHWCALADRAEVAEALLAAGFPLEDRESQGWSAVDLAARESPWRLDLAWSVAAALVEAGAHLAFDTACRLGRREVMEAYWRADPGCLVRPTRDGEPPLVEAARRGEADRVAWLLAAGAPVDQRGKRGQTPLLAAAAAGQSACYAPLLAAGADPAAADARGRTAGHLLTELGRARSVEAELAAWLDGGGQD